VNSRAIADALGPVMLLVVLGFLVAAELRICGH
jgi:hypothetical protein